jgi:hypothetical protein
MADQNTGGDGSVRWSIDADNVKLHESRHSDNGRLNHHGIDRSGTPGKDWFTVSIEVPKQFDGNAAKYLEALKGGGPFGLRADERDSNRVYFNVPIEKMNHDQMRISWGNSAHVLPPDPNTHRGN